MTPFLNHYTLKYTPLSPLHIGTGDSYEPTNYVIDDGTLYEFDTGGAIAALFDQGDRAELDKITKGKPDIQMLKAVQKFFYDRREAIKPWAINAIPVLDGVAKLYKSRVGQAANHEGGGGQVLNKLEIDRTAYNPATRQPVLFGSSVKGAIRTALLNQVNNKTPLSERNANLFQVENLTIPEKKQKEREQKKVFPRLNESLFKFQAGKFELDPMRLVQVGDAAWDAQDDLPTAQVFLTVNRKKHKVLDEHGDERKSQAENNQNLFKLLECVPPWRYQAFAAQLTIQQVNGLQAGSANSKLPKSELRFTMQYIAKTCSAFYLPILKAEMTLMRERGLLNSKWDLNIQALLTAMADKMLKGQVFLLRVGRHSGAESVTLNGVRNIKIMKANPEYQQQTKTLWLAAQSKDQRTNLLPFGWVLVEVETINSSANDWPELAELCKNQDGEASLWADKQAQQKTKLEEKRRETEQRRKQEDIERRQQMKHAEQAEQDRLAKEQEDQQRRASMTEQQLQIEALKQQLQQKQDANVREQIGGPLYSALRELINQSSAWSVDDKTELLGVAKQILELIGASSNRKAKELIKNLQ